MTTTAGRGASARRDALLVGGIAIAVRLGVVAWAASRIPPAADGVYYHRIATRIAEGHGYTWVWPDGVVTYAAHYPVGYPALVAIGYALFGPHPAVAMGVNALLGAAASVAGWSLLRTAATPRLAVAGGVALGLHPALVPYTPAIMTEGVTAALLAIAAAVAAHGREAPRPDRRRAWLALTGLVLGAATLVRPQSLALAPVVGWLAAAGVRDDPTSSGRARAVGAALVTVIAVLVCAPWTARNCARMERCALVSVNGGWNLAIGAQTETGAWNEIAVPEACKTVFQEAAKDACFGREATLTIARDPLRWLARAPAKLAATFDYLGAAPWYLHEASRESFPYGAKLALGAVETVAARLLLAAALVTVIRIGSGQRPRARRIVAALGLVACALVHAWIAYVALALALALLGRTLLRGPLVLPLSAAVLVTTALTHAAFFGAGRYGLVVLPFVTVIAFCRWETEPLAVAVRSLLRKP